VWPQGRAVDLASENLNLMAEQDDLDGGILVVTPLKAEQLQDADDAI
jgi:hypothetical protein